MMKQTAFGHETEDSDSAPGHLPRHRVVLLPATRSVVYRFAGARLSLAAPLPVRHFLCTKMSYAYVRAVLRPRLSVLAE